MQCNFLYILTPELANKLHDLLLQELIEENVETLTQEQQAILNALHAYSMLPFYKDSLSLIISEIIDFEHLPAFAESAFSGAQSNFDMLNENFAILKSWLQQRSYSLS